MITVLCGGVGGSKLALGLYRTLPPATLQVVVNTADDLTLWGLHISPDLDTVTYTLAGIAAQDTGWGIAGDTHQALDTLQRYGAPTWFQVGDRDLATDIYRTHALREGQTLSEIAAHLARSLDVHAGILPMSDAPVATRLLVGGQWLDFQDYFVRRRHRDPVAAVRYDGIEQARPTAQVLAALTEAEVIVLVNSNPLLSILPIISLPGIRPALEAVGTPRVAVSPIVGTDAVSGPAGQLMRLLELPASATGVAMAYRGLIDGLIIDRQDTVQAGAIERLGMAVYSTDTVMHDLADRERLAVQTLDFARTLR